VWTRYAIIGDNTTISVKFTGISLFTIGHLTQQTHFGI
jgi:hypothetical protein